MNRKFLYDLLAVFAVLGLLFWAGYMDGEDEIRTDCYQKHQDAECLTAPIVKGEVSLPK